MPSFRTWIERLIFRWDRSVRWVLRRLDNIGVHIHSEHFYSPVPSRKDLAVLRWSARKIPVGIDFREASQIDLLRDLSRRYGKEYSAFRARPDGVHSEGVYHYRNDTFGPVDAEILYSIVRWKRPHRIVEIGSGFSSLLIAEALTRNKKDNGWATQYKIIDPYPPTFLSRIAAGVAQSIRRPVQQVSLNVFRALERHDILFIDSSHVVKAGSDAQHLFLRVLPSLRKGVLVHVHDIFFPYDYPREWVEQFRRYWNEQYVLQTFLTHNRADRVIWASRYMHVRHPKLVANIFFANQHHRPSSLWFERFRETNDGHRSRSTRLSP